MRWRQFFTPIKSLTPDQARDLVRDTAVEEDFPQKRSSIIDKGFRFR